MCSYSNLPNSGFSEVCHHTWAIWCSEWNPVLLRTTQNAANWAAFPGFSRGLLILFWNTEVCFTTFFSEFQNNLWVFTFILFWDRVLLCSSDWLETPSIDQADFDWRHLIVSVSQELGLKTPYPAPSQAFSKAVCTLNSWWCLNICVHYLSTLFFVVLKI